MNKRKLVISLAGILLIAFGGLAATLLAGNTPSLGLDLQGGISVTQQPVGEFEAASLDLAVERIRERVDALGVSEPEIIRQGDAIVVNLPGVKNQQEAIDLVKVTGQVYLRPVLQCFAAPAPTDTSTGDISPVSTVTAGTPSANTADTSPVSTATAGTPSTNTAAPGPSRRPHSVPPSTDAPATDTPSTDTGSSDTATTTVTDGAPTTTLNVTSDSGVVDPATLTTQPPSDPTTSQILPLREGGQCYVGPSQGTGAVFDNDANADIISGGWGVTVSLRDGADGVDTWNAIAAQCYSGTETCPSKQLAIELDGEIISAPTVNQPSFTDSVQITGSFSESEARRLAQVLKSGSLPVRMETKSVQTVSPTLGKDSLHAAIVSGLIGVALVLLFMALYYRTLGLVVVAGLSVSSALLWTVISYLSTTQGLALSLSGVAGLIVSVGVTVDSYVVFFERLKDEVRSGRSMRNSAQRGFMGAWHTILVADLVSLIGAFVLWYLTVGSVRNFAFFLGLSTLADLVVAWFFTRPAVLLLARTDWMARRKVMGIEAVRAATPTSAAIVGGVS